MLGSSDEVNLCPSTVYPIGSMSTVPLPGKSWPFVEPVHMYLHKSPPKEMGDEKRYNGSSENRMQECKLDFCWFMI
jgi:hypothetical protein